MTEQSAHDYPPPVNRLLTYGDCRDRPGWPNYLKLGLGPEHTSDLIRMATDDNLHQAMSDSREVWAPIHAWRALGQLHAAAAIAPLLGLLHRIDDDNDDWVGEDLPRALALIGPAAIAPLAAYLADEQHGLYARVAASRALQ
ncbi:MAG TPA: hypothetical protein VJ754_01565, partial [Anaerolineae bacterium]|nr:hypothetical protein [Anaerolineae bacterium]